MKSTRPPHRRRGATMVETAIILSVFLTLILGTIDLAIGVYRYNTISEAARRGAREAIVHGRQAPPRRTEWGPATFNGTAADSSEQVRVVQSVLVGFEPQDVAIRLEWPDGGNEVGLRVRCTVTSPYRPVIGLLLGNRTVTLRAVSTMQIAN